MDLVCIPPGLAHETWPKVAPVLKAAMLKTNLSHSADLEEQVLRGDGLIWLAIENSEIQAVATTILQKTDTNLVCVITACAGHGLPQWLPLLRQIEDWARFEGAACVRIYGRRGWVRALPDYRETNIVIEKAL